MNNRQRFNATMHYQPRDRAPLLDFGFWDETLIVWHDQGLPADITDNASASRFFCMDFGLDELINSTGAWAGLAPRFEEGVVEDLGEHVIYQQWDGVRVKRQKFMRTIPHIVSRMLVDRASWRAHYKPRLDPANPSRYPDDWDARVQVWRDPRRDFPICLHAGSLLGWIRNWVGIENLAMLLYDDLAWVEEMVETVADCSMGMLTRVLETGGAFDSCHMWEDICYNAGPLISPKHFKRLLVPHYRRITDLLHRHGVDVVWLDCDGKIDQLIPLWLDAGVNCMFPLEIGTWGADPIRYRQEYGKDLLMMGGFDKHILARSHHAIAAEVLRLTPLIEEGGFVAFCDHRVPPDVPYENYVFFVKMAREVWGNNSDLKPQGRLNEPAHALPALVNGMRRNAQARQTEWAQ